MIGYMANNVLPLRAGEVVRVYVVARRWSAVGAGGTGHAFWTVLATLIVERVLDSLAVVLMLAVLVLVVPVPAFLQAAALAVLAIDLAGIAVLVALVAAPARCARLIERLSARWPRLRHRLPRRSGARGRPLRCRPGGRRRLRARLPREPDPARDRARLGLPPP